MKPDRGQQHGVNLVHYLEKVLGHDFGFQTADFEADGMPKVVQFLADRGVRLERVAEPLGVCKARCGKVLAGQAPACRMRHSTWRVVDVGDSPKLCWVHYNEVVRVSEQLLSAHSRYPHSSGVKGGNKRSRLSGVAAKSAEVASAVAATLDLHGISSESEGKAVAAALRSRHPAAAAVLLQTGGGMSVTEDGLEEFCSQMLRVLQRDGISQEAAMEAKAQLMASMMALVDGGLPVAVSAKFTKTVAKYAKNAEGNVVAPVTYAKRGPNPVEALAAFRHFLESNSHASAHLTNAAGDTIRILVWSHANALFLAYAAAIGSRGRSWVFETLPRVIRGRFHWARQHNCLCELCAEAHELNERLTGVFARADGDLPPGHRIHEILGAHAEWLQHGAVGLRNCLSHLASGSVHSPCVDHCIIRMFGACDECDDMMEEHERCWACSKFHTLLQQLRVDFPYLMTMWALFRNALQ